MKFYRGLVVSGAIIGWGNLFGQTSPPSQVATAVAAVVNGVTVVVATPRVPSNARITNLSTRARVTGENPLMTGFAIRGDAPRTVLVRAAGPALGAFGVANTLAAPQLRLHAADGSVILENAGWGGGQALTNTFARVGAFPFAADSADAAAVVTLAPGTYTVEIVAGSGGPGVALAEIYDVEGKAEGSRLVNVSTRSTVASAGGELISGLVVAGTTSQQFLVRGIGPALTKFGVTGVLGDPVITIFNTGGTPIATNNNWGQGGRLVAATTTGGMAVVTAMPIGAVMVPGVAVNISPGVVSVVASAAQAAALAAQAAASAVAVEENLVTSAAASVGAFGLDRGSADSAVVVTLAPGAYTVQISGATSADTGAALIEIYELP